MDYPIALIWALAAGRESELFAMLPISLVEGERVIAVEQPEGTFRFLYHRIRAEDGADAITLSARPSSGSAGAWHLYILQAIDDTRPAVMRELRDRLETWAAAHQPTPGGKYHLLGPYAPATFRALVPEAVWDACVHSWAPIWRAESSAAGMAAQLAATDDDLVDVVD